jgi:hypothetical protein
MTWELLDVATQYATGKEVVQANFSGKVKAVRHLNGGDGGDDPASSQRHHDKQNKDRKYYEEEMVATADHATRPQTRGRDARPKHFEKVLESPCSFHGGQARHLLKVCATMKGYIRSTLDQ